jgi:pimeloyl-ACP methyl ester carboxylesterase
MLPVPVLAIFACPHNFDFDRTLRNNPGLKAQVVAEDIFTTTRQADAFASGVPSAHVVRIANADHYVFRSNQADVIKEMNAFLSKLH